MKDIDVEAATLSELVEAASDYLDVVWVVLLELRRRTGEDNPMMDSSLLSEKEGRLTQREAVRGKTLVRRDDVRVNRRNEVSIRERAVDFKCVGRDAEAGD